MMHFVEPLSAVWASVLLVDFLFGIACGMAGGASLGSVSEDGKRSLLQPAPGALSDGARIIHGVYTRDDDGYLRWLLHGRVRRSDGSSGSYGKEMDR